MTNNLLRPDHHTNIWKESEHNRMAGTVDIVAIISPKPGKADRVEELLAEQAKWVKENEPNTLRYHLQRETKGDAPKFIMLET